MNAWCFVDEFMEQIELHQFNVYILFTDFTQMGIFKSKHLFLKKEVCAHWFGSGVFLVPSCYFFLQMHQQQHPFLKEFSIQKIGFTGQSQFTTSLFSSLALETSISALSQSCTPSFILLGRQRHSLSLSVFGAYLQPLEALTTKPIP